MTREPDRPWAADVLREGNEDFFEALAAKQSAFRAGWEEVMRIAADLALEGDIEKTTIVWRDPAPQTISGTSDAITK